MHNLNTEALQATIDAAQADPAADDHCPGAFCIRNPIELKTHLEG